jgi:hypothetical protein
MGFRTTIIAWLEILQCSIFQSSLSPTWLVPGEKSDENVSPTKGATTRGLTTPQGPLSYAEEFVSEASSMGSAGRHLQDVDGGGGSTKGKTAMAKMRKMLPKMSPRKFFQLSSRTSSEKIR